MKGVFLKGKREDGLRLLILLSLHPVSSALSFQDLEMSGRRAYIRCMERTISPDGFCLWVTIVISWGMSKVGSIEYGLPILDEDE